MNYSKLNAHEAYDAGLKTRIDQKSECGPMPRSKYKLLECQRDFDRIKDQISRIGKYTISNSKDFHFFGCCTSEDSHVWAKAIPAHMCHSLGCDLVGVLHGLPGDGVSGRVIKKIENEVQRRIPALLDLGDWARIETERSWKRVSMQLGTGESELDEFINKANDLIDWVMYTLKKGNVQMEFTKLIEGLINDSKD